MYKRLTKEIEDEKHNKFVVCALYGTDECHIHSGKALECGKCPAMAAMICQLHAFEEVMDEE